MHQDGIDASVSATIKERIGIAWGRLNQVKTVLKHPVMNSRGGGWLRAAVSLFQAIIPPILLYSSETWIDVKRYQIDELESAYKDMLYSLLSLPQKTKTVAVLLECGFQKVETLMMIRKINFINYIIWELPNSRIHRVLLEDRRINKDNVVLKTDRICDKYGIERVSEGWLAPEYVTNRIKIKMNTEMWSACNLSRKVFNKPDPRDNVTSYWDMEKSAAISILSFKVGALRFKDTWKISNSVKFKDKKCPVNNCEGIDSLKHVLFECSGYTKWKSKDIFQPEFDEREFSEHLVKINRIRLTKFNSPIFYV